MPLKIIQNLRKINQVKTKIKIYRMIKIKIKINPKKETNKIQKLFLVKKQESILKEIKKFQKWMKNKRIMTLEKKDHLIHLKVEQFMMENGEEI